MTYVPIEVTIAELDDTITRNIHALVTEYAIANTYILFQDTETPSDYPVYTIFIPEVIGNTRLANKSNQTYYFSVLIDCDTLSTKGSWRKTSEMKDALHNGLITEEDNGNLKEARLSYLGCEAISSEPIIVNRQQVFSKTVRYQFKVLL